MPKGRPHLPTIIFHRRAVKFRGYNFISILAKFKLRCQCFSHSMNSPVRDGVSSSINFGTKKDANDLSLRYSICFVFPIFSEKFNQGKEDHGKEILNMGDVWFLLRCSFSANKNLGERRVFNHGHVEVEAKKCAKKKREGCCAWGMLLYLYYI